MFIWLYFGGLCGWLSPQIDFCFAPISGQSTTTVFLSVRFIDHGLVLLGIVWVYFDVVVIGEQVGERLRLGYILFWSMYELIMM